MMRMVWKREEGMTFAEMVMLLFIVTVTAIPLLYLANSVFQLNESNLRNDQFLESMYQEIDSIKRAGENREKDKISLMGGDVLCTKEAYEEELDFFQEKLTAEKVKFRCESEKLMDSITFSVVKGKMPEGG